MKKITCVSYLKNITQILEKQKIKMLVKTKSMFNTRLICINECTVA